MIFSVSIGTCGKGKEGYLLYLPIVLSPGRDLLNINFEKEISVGEYKLRFIKLAYFNALTLGKFESESVARKYIGKLQAALMWVTLKHLIGINFPEIESEIKWLDEPKLIPEEGIIKKITENTNWDATDGTYYSDKLGILPDHKRLIRWDMGRVNIKAGLSVDNFIATVQEALSFSVPENVVEDRKLRLAINIFSSYFFEQSPEAKFIKLVTVLEALTPDSIVSDQSQEMLRVLKLTVKNAQNQYAKDSSEWKELNGILSRVGQLKRNSIGISLRNFVAAELFRDSAIGDSNEIVYRLKDIYDRRSKLLHEGFMDIGLLKADLEFLTVFVPRLLKSVYMLEANKQKI